MLKEHRDKIAESDAKDVEAAIEETKRAIGQGDLAQINAAADKLTQASHKLAEAMYKSSAGQPGGPGPGAGGPQTDGGPSPHGPSEGKDNVVDAEFVDVDDKNK